MTEEALKRLVLQRGHLKAQITRFYKYVESLEDDAPVIELQTRLDIIANVWDTFGNIQGDIDFILDGTDRAAQQEGEREAFENMYYAAIALGKQRVLQGENIGRVQQQATRSTGASTPRSEPALNVKLPTISLPTFDGTYENWLQYRDTFISLIHDNEQLSCIQRFHYLRASLKGEALRVVQAITISSENYNTAWQALSERFENKRMLVHNHVKALFDLPVVIKESHQALRKLMDDTLNHTRTLETLGQPTSHWDTLLIHLVSVKFDSTTKRAWEKQLATTTDPTFKMLTDFLTERCQVLESVTNTKQIVTQPHAPYVPTKHSTRKSMNFLTSQVVTNRNTCPLCKQGHSIFNCEAFMTMSPAQRIQETKRRYLCFNCLKAGHHNGQCISGGCKKCNKRHNSLLHLDEIDCDQNNAIGGASNASTSVVSNCASFQNSYVFLSTASLYVYDKMGRKHNCRALLDSGS